MSDACTPAMDVQMAAQGEGMPRSFWPSLSVLLMWDDGYSRVAVRRGLVAREARHERATSAPSNNSTPQAKAPGSNQASRYGDAHCHAHRGVDSSGKQSNKYAIRAAGLARP
jgi:hypothetical protein